MEQSANLCVQLKQVSHCAKLWLVPASRTSKTAIQFLIFFSFYFCWIRIRNQEVRIQEKVPDPTGSGLITLPSVENYLERKRYRMLKITSIWGHFYVVEVENWNWIDEGTHRKSLPVLIL